MQDLCIRSEGLISLANDDILRLVQRIRGLQKMELNGRNNIIRTSDPPTLTLLSVS